MTPQEILKLTAELIEIPSLTGNEIDVVNFLQQRCQSFGWNVEVVPLAPKRANLLVKFGTPEILLTTHTDVVGAPPELFKARLVNQKVIGRGACDAKGIIATMIAAAHELTRKKISNFALLFVAGEEIDGIGANDAAQRYQNAGIKYLINGEPTESRLVHATKGGFVLELNVTGKAAHSGYPERGDDANLKMAKLIVKLCEADLGSDPDLGQATINFGEIEAGLSANVVSPHARSIAMVRPVLSCNQTLERIKAIVGSLARIDVINPMDPVRLTKLNGFESEVASFCTDIPNFAPLAAKNFLFGPGSIHVAHTDHESLSQEEATAGLAGYLKIIELLRKA